MRKTLSLVLALLLLIVLSAGTVLAKSDNSNNRGNSNNDKKVSDSVKLQNYKQTGQEVQQKSKVEKMAKKSNKNRIQENIKKLVQEQYRAFLTQRNSLENKNFSDISQHWAAQCIQEMTAVKLFSGYPDGTFKPDQRLTQVEALALVIRISEQNTVAADNETSPDEEANETELAEVPAWAREDAAKAAKKGIIKLNRFHSAVQATRAETAVMIAKALGLEPVDTSNMPFKDGLLISKEDAGYILALYQEGILSGNPNGNFNPNSGITRAEMATILQRLLKNSEIESVSLPATATVEQGKSITLEAAVKYADGTSDKAVSWSSNDTTLATVDNGVVKAAADKTGTVTITATAARGEITKTATCLVTIVEEQPVIAGTLSATGSVAGRDGKVYEEYTFKVNTELFSLAHTNVKSMTLQKEGAEVVQLSPGSDSGLWFDVQHESGKYILMAIDLNDKAYSATLEWTAPTPITAAATGGIREINGNSYVEYKLGDLDLSKVTCIYQIRPNNQVVEWIIGTDINLWMQTDGQISGQHIFLIKKNGAWSSASITI